MDILSASSLGGGGSNVQPRHLVSLLDESAIIYLFI